MRRRISDVRGVWLEEGGLGLKPPSEGGLFLPGLCLPSARDQLPGVLEGPPVYGKIEPQELGPWKSFWRRGEVSVPLPECPVLCAASWPPRWARHPLPPSPLPRDPKIRPIGATQPIWGRKAWSRHGTATSGPQGPPPTPWRSQRGDPCKMCHPEVGFIRWVLAGALVS